MKQRIISFLARHPSMVLLLMTLSFLGFGYFSLNLFFLFKASIELLAKYGVMVLEDGAALQLAMIFLSGLASSIFYTSLKLCERLLVDWIVAD